MGENKTMTESEILDLLGKGYHILTKNYHDGHGRQYWLRDDEQNDVYTMSKKEFQGIKSKLKFEHVISSDEAYLCTLRK